MKALLLNLHVGYVRSETLQDIFSTIYCVTELNQYKFATMEVVIIKMISYIANGQNAFAPLI